MNLGDLSSMRSRTGRLPTAIVRASLFLRLSVYVTRDPSLPSVIAAAPDDPLLNPHYHRIAALKPLGLEGGATYLEELLVEFGGTRKGARRAIAALVLALAHEAPKEDSGIT